MISRDERYKMYFWSVTLSFKRKAWVVILLLFFVSCKDEPAPIEPEPFTRVVEDQQLQSTILNRSVTYNVLLPEGYNESSDSYPVVYLLHGYGDNHTAWSTFGGLQYYVDKHIGETVPMIYVMPQAYNTYYIDRYNGNYPYMQMFVNELVPAIDEKFRTKKDKTQRAVMGYSMGGYGALILPALNPDVFTISVPLSMSFRTDEQYIAESQSSFDNQWAPNFGPGYGVSGDARLTEYFKTRSPFHFFDQDNLTAFSNLKILIDCGDDEETLSNTNDNLHALMRDRQIAHEYRVRSGGHSFDYWKKSYPEALKFISNAVQGIEHPSEPSPFAIGTLIKEGDYSPLEVSGLTLNVLKPTDYQTSGVEYPVLYFIHDVDGGERMKKVIDVFSLLRNAMTSSQLTKSIVVEIPDAENINSTLMEEIISQVDATFRTKESGMNRVMMANASGGIRATTIVSENPEMFGSCFLLCAEVANEIANANAFYYLDITDDCDGYEGYNKLYTQIRMTGVEYEYRVRQGGESYQSFLNGLGESLASLKKRLNK